MTAKRFSKYVPDSYNYTSIITIVDHETNKRSGSIDDFVDMMNALHEEKEQLKTIINQLRTDNTKQKKLLNTTMKENEQLKHQLQQQELEYTTTCHRLAEENEQCKMMIATLRNIILENGIDIV